MGAYYLVVNPVSRQYLDPARFGEAFKLPSVLRGEHCIEALKLLSADCFRRDGSSFRGAWLGEPVVRASDDSGLPGPGGLTTVNPDDDGRNLHTMARAEFTDISYRALAELCRDGASAAELAGRSKEDGSLLIDLGATLEPYRQATLEAALTAAVGLPWRKAYDQARAALPWWSPLPPIDWPLQQIIAHVGWRVTSTFRVSMVVAHRICESIQVRP